MRNSKSHANGSRTAAWTRRIRGPGPESRGIRAAARTGGLSAIAAFVGYLTWRIAVALPMGVRNRTVGRPLAGFELLPLVGLVLVTSRLPSRVRCPQGSIMRIET
jgi:hypothetical protein